MGGHGTCVDGLCQCDPGYMGKPGCPNDCSITLCPNSCSGHGNCDLTTGTCTCDVGWVGTDCGQGTCKNGCSGQGYCVAGKCHCFECYTGEDCSKRPEMVED